MEPLTGPLAPYLCASDCNPYSSDGATLAFGQDADGRILHVSEVASGLACGCSCPACRAKLVAHKGQIKIHHFAHYGVGECKSASETALHKFAKQVLDEERKLLIPAIVAEQDRHRYEMHRPKTLRFDGATLEHRLHDVVPDVILRKSDRDLLVEIAVTHFCDETKIARIKALNVSAIEIDLSGLSRNAAREEIAQAILRSAPRKWIFNPRLGDAEAELQRRIKQENEKRVAPIRRLLENRRPLVQSEDGSLLVQKLSTEGFDEAIGIPIEGDICFRVPRSHWQAFIVETFIASALRRNADYWRPIQTRAVFKEMRSAQMLRPELCIFIDNAMEQNIREHEKNFRAPYHVVKAYLMKLQGLGILEATGRSLVISRQLERDWEERRRIAEEAREQLEERQFRQDSVIGVIHRCLDKIPSEEKMTFSIEHWIGQGIREIGASPRDCIRDGGETYNALHSKLFDIDHMFLSWGKVPDLLLGLPLHHERQRQIATRAKAAEDEKRRAEEAARQAADARMSKFGSEVSSTLGNGRNWAQAPCHRLDNRSPMELARESEDGLQRARYALAAESREQEREQLREEVAERSRALLASEAQRRLSPPYATLFLNTSQPRLGGRRPIEYCRDQATLEQCRQLLVATPRL